MYQPNIPCSIGELDIKILTLKAVLVCLGRCVFVLLCQILGVRQIWLFWLLLCLGAS